MTVPLALFLTNFNSPPAAVIEAMDFSDASSLPGELEPLAFDDREGEIARAVEAAMLEAGERHATELAELNAAHESATAAALAAAREDWAASTGATFTANLESAVGALRNSLSDGLAAVLRPLLADAVRTRVSTELVGALDRLLVDSAQPLLRVRGPEDLCAALHAARPAVEIEWVIDESADVELIAGATHIETKLAAALADIAATES